jgi:flagellar motor switch protein FliG
MVSDDIGIQKLLGIAAHVDVLVLLKAAEADGELLAKLYGNMSERSRKMFEEDLEYRFKDPIPEADVVKAIGRLAEAANELEKQET